MQTSEGEIREKAFLFEPSNVAAIEIPWSHRSRIKAVLGQKAKQKVWHVGRAKLIIDKAINL